VKKVIEVVKVSKIGNLLEKLEHFANLLHQLNI